ncbi:MAG: PDZ domain-containing protein [Planctomycetes bacterium]|nr:PDZ domain-containing protein [Planctomycetota bacterium]
MRAANGTLRAIDCATVLRRTIASPLPRSARRLLCGVALAGALLPAPLLAQGGWLGVFPAEEPVPAIGEVVPGSPAARAGLRIGDVVIAVDGEAVRTVEQLADRIGARRPGDAVRLLVERGAAVLELRVVLTARPERAGDPARPVPGSPRSGGAPAVEGAGAPRSVGLVVEPVRDAPGLVVVDALAATAVAPAIGSVIVELDGVRLPAGAAALQRWLDAVERAPVAGLELRCADDPLPRRVPLRPVEELLAAGSAAPGPLAIVEPRGAELADGAAVAARRGLPLLRVYVRTADDPDSARLLQELARPALAGALRGFVVETIDAARAGSLLADDAVDELPQLVVRTAPDSVSARVAGRPTAAELADILAVHAWRPVRWSAVPPLARAAALERELRALRALIRELEEERDALRREAARR